MNPFDRIMLDLVRKLCPKGYHVQGNGGGQRKPKSSDFPETTKTLERIDAYTQQVNEGVNRQEKFSLSEWNK